MLFVIRELPDFADTTFWSQLDYTCGIIPVTHVSSGNDVLPPTISSKSLNGVARGAYKHYVAIEMAGLPVGVQVVGQRLQEERVLAVMQRIEEALERHNGGIYELMQPF